MAVSVPAAEEDLGFDEPAVAYGDVLDTAIALACLQFALVEQDDPSGADGNEFENLPAPKPGRGGKAAQRSRNADLSR